MSVYYRNKRVRLAGTLLVVCATFSQASASDGAATLSAVSGEALIPAGATAPLSEGNGRFVLVDWGGPAIPVWSYVPTQSSPATLPMVIVMHGADRDASRYRDEWSALAQLNRFVVIAPEFSKEAFPGSAGYNLGNVFDRNEHARREEKSWAFSAIEPLFDAVVRQLDSTQTEYILYGHSAGSQFVHRFLFYKPDARVKHYIAANAGWYTLPDFSEPYPYGLNGAGVDPGALKSVLQRNVVVLLGDHDNDATDSKLRRTPEALSQGAHRLARGRSFFTHAEQQAKALGVPFNWRMHVVRYARHSNGEMAIGAVSLGLIE